MNHKTIRLTALKLRNGLKNRLRSVGVSACLACMLSGVAAAPVTLRDDRGVSVTFAAPPARIVSLLPSLTETLCALQACSRLVGVDRYSNWPDSVNTLPRLGGLEDAQIERIVALKPDVVVLASSARVVDRLEAMGVKVLTLEPKSHADTRRVLHTVAALLGQPEAGDALWQGIEARIRLARDRVPKGWRGQRVYFEVGTGPYAAGESSFIGETLAKLGLANVAPASLGPFPKLNPEFVIRADPDLMMAPSADLAEMPKRPGWGALHALRQGRQCGFDSVRYDMLVRPGPRMGEAAEAISDCLVALAKVSP